MYRTFYFFSDGCFNFHIYITKTRPCNIQNFFFLVVKMKIFSGKKNDIFLIFAQNIDCGYTLVLTSTHNLCFGAKIRKIDKPPHTPVLLHKTGVCRGIYFTDMIS